MSDTLVLNASYEVLGLITWQRAMTLLFEGKIEVVEEYEGRDLRSVSLTIRMPSVVRFLKFIRGRKRAVKFSRENIFARDGGRCQYCAEAVKRSEFTYDHVVPRRLGGQTNWTNVVTCCLPCNQRKGGRTPAEANMLLRSKPIKPTKMPDQISFTLSFHKNMPPSWRQWLTDVAYWNGDMEQE